MEKGLNVELSKVNEQTASITLTHAFRMNISITSQFTSHWQSIKRSNSVTDLIRLEALFHRHSESHIVANAAPNSDTKVGRGKRVEI